MRYLHCNVIKRFWPYFVFMCYLFQLSNLKNSFTHQLLMPLEGKLTTALNLFSLLIFKNATLICMHFVLVWHLYLLTIINIQINRNGSVKAQDWGGHHHIISGKLITSLYFIIHDTRFCFLQVKESYCSIPSLPRHTFSVYIFIIYTLCFCIFCTK